ncbi:prephenate dehydrogenase [Rothia nasimurium]|uniref:Prephenate dehydrogenase n=1 Tax=Rothia nasimurium TaxID=85336 RepID=A0A4Y9F1D8_9MICC|nr:prephenate dehydrogenase [Rothia nasimurium]MBF0808925.1 prephenate dehydrogenase [Rothia nasimurium]TFU21050.1 prephenate dehydrogenase [Rothia nasimurium]
MSGSPTVFDSHLHGPVLVIGAGLLGASIGLGLSHRGYTVYISDISPTTEAVAEDIGAGASLRALAHEWQGKTGQDAPAQLELAPQLVVVAAPPDVTADLVVRALADYPASFVIDIASVKSGILSAVQEAGADVGRYLGTHPMAGREKSGPVAARGELFSARPWVLCDHETVRPELVKVVQQLAAELGSTITHMDVEEHDRTVALISHVPQVMSSLLASRLQDTPLYALGLAGQGLRDTTRIAASDPGLWVQILSANAEPVVQTLYGVREDLERLISTLEAPTAAGARLDIAQLMSEGNSGVARIPGKHGGSPSAFAQLTVLVDDTPGTLARLLVEIGELGVNLEDLRLEHSPGAQVGMAEISVNPNEHEKLIEDLTSRGWKVVK